MKPFPTASSSEEGSRLRSVGDALDAYRALEGALDLADDADLAWLVESSRATEAAFGAYADRVQAVRELRGELARAARGEAADEAPAIEMIRTSHDEPPSAAALVASRSLVEPFPLFWEVLAFSVGLGASWLLLI